MGGKKITKKSADKKKRSETVLNWVLINIGTLILAVGVYFFKAPNNFATGGVSGLSIILVPALHKLSFLKSFKEGQIMTVTNLVINALLLLVGFIFLGKGCTFKTAYCSIVYSLEAWLLTFIPLPHPLPLTNEVFLEFAIAMITTGIGSAILFNCGASSGGTDIIALIIKKYAKLNIGIALTVADLIIACSTFFVFKSPTIGLYSVLGLFAKSFLVDGIIENIGKNKFLTIISENPDLVTPFILEGMHRGYTSYKATGGFSGVEKTIIVTVCKRGEAMKLKAQINKADPNAFVIVTDTTEIIGKGFKDRF